MVAREMKITSRTRQILARTKRCRELTMGGMPLGDALKEAQILRKTYDEYLPVLARMPSWQLIELPVPAKRKKIKAPK